MNLEALVDELSSSFRGKVQRSVPFASLTTYRLGGPAALLVEPADAADVDVLAAALRTTGFSADDDPVLVVGRGSNLLVADDGFPGLVIKLGASFSWIRAAPGEDEDAPVIFDAGSSTTLPLLANWAARRALTGLEFAVSIPGSVGGGVRMNAGAHGGQLSDCVTGARVFDLVRLTVTDVRADDLGLSYRRSALRASDVVVEARFRLRRGERAEIQTRMERFRRHRAATQPGALQNAGSVFKNPPGDSAGRLVEACGLKGFRVGGAQVSTLHANFFVADAGARAQDVYDLIHEVRARVAQTAGVELEPEVRFVGRFEERTKS